MKYRANIKSLVMVSLLLTLDVCAIEDLNYFEGSSHYSDFESGSSSGSGIDSGIDSGIGSGIDSGSGIDISSGESDESFPAVLDFEQCLSDSLPKGHYLYFQNDDKDNSNASYRIIRFLNDHWEYTWYYNARFSYDNKADILQLEQLDNVWYFPHSSDPIIKTLINKERANQIQLKKACGWVNKGFDIRFLIKPPENNDDPGYSFWGSGDENDAIFALKPPEPHKDMTQTDTGFYSSVNPSPLPLDVFTGRAEEACFQADFYSDRDLMVYWCKAYNDGDDWFYFQNDMLVLPYLQRFQRQYADSNNTLKLDSYSDGSIVPYIADHNMTLTETDKLRLFDEYRAFTEEQCEIEGYQLSGMRAYSTKRRSHMCDSQLGADKLVAIAPDRNMRVHVNEADGYTILIYSSYYTRAQEILVGTDKCLAEGLKIGYMLQPLRFRQNIVCVDPDALAPHTDAPDPETPKTPAASTDLWTEVYDATAQTSSALSSTALNNAILFTVVSIIIHGVLPSY